MLSPSTVRVVRILSFRAISSENVSRRLKSDAESIKYLRTLELDVEHCTQDLVRRQYISLVKKYHPDAFQGSREKFEQIDEAFRKLQEKFREDKRKEEECVGEYGLYYEKPEEDDDYEHPDIRHTAPQHRQYLSNEGFGFGTPGQRQQQYQKYRAFKASENVFRHKVEKLTAKYETRLEHQDKKRSKKHMTQNALERVVEDLISESMAKGEFENLSGSGRPLPERTRYNPYMDFTSNKMNEILAEGGFAPEWIMLKKDIRNDMEGIRDMLSRRSHELFIIGKRKTVEDVMELWRIFLDKLSQNEVRALNKNIDQYNLVVPMMHGQMFHFELEKEAAKIWNKRQQQNEGCIMADSDDKLDEVERSAMTGKNVLFALRNVFSALCSSRTSNSDQQR